MGKYTDKDIRKETNSSRREVSKAGHQFRDDSGTREDRDREVINGPSPLIERDLASPSGILDFFFGGKGKGSPGE